MADQRLLIGIVVLLILVVVAFAAAWFWEWRKRKSIEKKHLYIIAKTQLVL